MSEKFWVYLSMLGAMIFWGISFIWTKQVLNDGFLPMSIVFFRLLISAVLLLLIGKISHQLQPIGRRDVWPLLLLTFFQPFLYFIGETYGLKYVSSTVASVIIATIPLFSPLAAFYFFKEKVTLMNFFGILISIVGIFFVIAKTNTHNLFQTDIPFVGLAFLMLAVVSAIGYSVVVVKISGRFNVYNIITYQNTLGVLFFLPFVLYSDNQVFFRLVTSTPDFVPIVYLSVFASTGAFMMFTYGIKKLGVTRANTLANIIPVFTAAFAYWLIGEKLELINVLGIGIVLIGLFLSQIHRTHYFRFVEYLAGRRKYLSGLKNDASSPKSSS